MAENASDVFLLRKQTNEAVVDRLILLFVKKSNTVDSSLVDNVRH